MKESARTRIPPGQRNPPTMEGSTAVQRSPDETQRLTGRNGGSECTSRRPARLAASLFTHVLALVLLILVSASLKQNFVGEGQALLTWRTFPLHPFLMTLAFGFLAPIGAASWRSYSTLLGLSHGTMKVVHAGCMMLAALIGTLGVIDMWLVHADGAQAQLAKGWAVHFQSAHSWVRERVKQRRRCQSCSAEVRRAGVA